MNVDRIKKWAPGISLLFAYDRSQFWKDALSAVVVTLVLIPSAFAYADLAECAPAAGFYASVSGMVALALFTSASWGIQLAQSLNAADNIPSNRLQDHFENQQNPSMQIEVTREDDISIAKLSGVLDENAPGPFEEQLHPLITDQGKRLIIDLSGVPRVTSSGLSCLVTLVARANTKGSKVVLAAATPFVESVIGVTRLDRFFTMAPTVERAVQG